MYSLFNLKPKVFTLLVLKRATGTSTYPSSSVFPGITNLAASPMFDPSWNINLKPILKLWIFPEDSFTVKLMSEYEPLGITVAWAVEPVPSLCEPLKVIEGPVTSYLNLKLCIVCESFNL